MGSACAARGRTAGVPSNHERHLRRFARPRPLTHPEDEADGGHPRRGHDLGAVGHEVQQDGHDALGAVVELVPQQGGQVPVGRRGRGQA